MSVFVTIPSTDLSIWIPKAHSVNLRKQKKQIGNLFFSPNRKKKMPQKGDYFFHFSLNFHYRVQSLFGVKKTFFFCTLPPSRKEKHTRNCLIIARFVEKQFLVFTRGGGNYSEPRFREKQSNFFFGGGGFFPLFSRGGQLFGNFGYLSFISLLVFHDARNLQMTPRRRII